jgi:hypothetical protein
MRIREKAVLCPTIIIFTMVMATVVWGQGVDYILGELGVSENSTHHGMRYNAKNLGKLADLLKKSPTLRVHFRESSRPAFYDSDIDIDVIGTATGATVKYWRSKYYCVVEFNMKEWHDFLTSLYYSGIRNWGPYYDSGELDGWRWYFCIETEEKVLALSSGDRHPPYWQTFRNVIDSLVSNTIYKQKFRHSSMYEKRFGIPMSDLHGSVKNVTFYDKGYATKIFLTQADTVFAGYSQGAIWLTTKLTIDDWLDIIHTLNIDSVCANKSKSKTRNNNKLNDTCKITNLLSLDALNKTMLNIRAKIRKNTGIDAFENELEKEYRKKFNKQISEFERSLIRVHFRDSNKFVEVRRSPNGADVTNETRCITCLTNCIGLLCKDKCRVKECSIAKLNVAEWLDFVHALYMISFAKWNNFENERMSWYRDVDKEINIEFLDNNKQIVFRGYDTYEPEKPTQKTIDKKPKWNVEVDFSDNQPLWYGDNEKYPPNWKILSNLMSNLEVKILNSETGTDGK